MKKLESLENFKKNQLSETHQSNVFGGVATAGGCMNVETYKSASGCASFTSDDVNGDSASYSGVEDITDCDELAPVMGGKPTNFVNKL